MLICRVLVGNPGAVTAVLVVAPSDAMYRTPPVVPVAVPEVQNAEPSTEATPRMLLAKYASVTAVVVSMLPAMSIRAITRAAADATTPIAPGMAPYPPMTKYRPSVDRFNWPSLDAVPESANGWFPPLAAVGSATDCTSAPVRLYSSSITALAAFVSVAPPTVPTREVTRLPDVKGAAEAAPTTTSNDNAETVTVLFFIISLNLQSAQLCVNLAPATARPAQPNRAVRLAIICGHSGSSRTDDPLQKQTSPQHEPRHRISPTDRLKAASRARLAGALCKVSNLFVPPVTHCR